MKPILTTLFLAFILCVNQSFANADCPCDDPAAYATCGTTSTVIPDYVNPIANLGFTFQTVTYSTAPRYGETLAGVGGIDNCGNCSYGFACPTLPCSLYNWPGSIGNQLSCCEDLEMNIYTPCNTDPDRPAVILAPGGAFHVNDHCKKHVQFLARELVSRGYVVATISYRKFNQSRTKKCANLNFTDYYDDLVTDCGQTEADIAKMEMFYKTAQDGKAAVKYLKANAATYGIDGQNVFFSGMSAGAAVALHSTYLDPTDLPVNWSGYTDFGDFHETAVQTNETDVVAGVLSLWGAIDDLDWIEPSDVPLFAVHGTCDEAVHYQEGELLGGMFGAEPMVSKAFNTSTSFQLLSVCGGRHSMMKATQDCLEKPGCAVVNDAIIPRMSQFMANIRNNSLPPVTVEYEDANNFLGCMPLGNCNALNPLLKDVNGVVDPNYCPMDFAGLNLTYTKTSLLEEQESVEILVYPNPVTNGVLWLQTTQGINGKVELVDLLGRSRWLNPIQGRNRQIGFDVSQVPFGNYILKVENQFFRLLITE